MATARAMKSVVFLSWASGGGYSDVDVDVEVDSTGTGIGTGIGRKPMISTGNGNARRPLSYFTSLLPSDGGDSLPVCSSVFEYSLLRSPALSGLRNDFVVQCRVLESG
jgi:hypothetical protein